MKARPTQSRKGVKGGLRPFSSAPCRVKGQRPLWGLGQRPNSSTDDQFQGNRQQRRRQRSVPASNFALPQERPQAALPTTCTLSRQMGATDQHRETIPVLVFFIAGDFASADATRGLSARPLDPFGCALPYFWGIGAEPTSSVAAATSSQKGKARRGARHQAFPSGEGAEGG